MSHNQAIFRRVEETECREILKEFRVLVVDDDALTRETIGRMLQGLGISKVEQASNGEHALEILKKMPVDIIMADIHMPRMDGLSLLKMVKGVWPHVPVLVLSGYGNMETALEAMRFGATDFILKPFSRENIQISLQRAARERDLFIKNALFHRGLHGQTKLEPITYRLELKLRELSKLYAINESIQPGHVDEHELLERIVDMAAQITEARKVWLFLVSEKGDDFVLTASKGLTNEDKSTDPSELSPWLERDLMAGSDVVTWERAVTVPIKIGGETLGLLGVGEKASGEEFNEEDKALLRALAQRASLAIENKMLYEGIYSTVTETLFSLVSIIEARDPCTKDHSQRVTQWAVQISKAMGFNREQQEMIRFAGYLHDIGKIGIKDSILMKQGALSPEELEVIKSHPVIGEKLVKPLGLLPIERSVIRHHHERWDGKGYPDGLAGEEIPLSARIVAVADVLDAITSDRVYRKGKSLKDALCEIQRYGGTQLDPQLVKVLIELVLKGNHP